MAAFALALSLGGANAHADTLVGQNGDTLKGQLVEEKDGRIIFLSDFLGRLEVSSDKAHIVRDPDAATLQLPANSATAPSPTAASGNSAPWSVDVGVKLNFDRGSLKSNEDRLDASAVLSHRTPRGDLHGNFDYKYKNTNGALGDNDWTASFGYERLVSARRFNAVRLYAANELTSAGYDSTRAASAATGWRLWEAPEHFLRIGPALGYVAVTRGGQRFSGPALGVYARGMTPLVGRARLTGELQFFDTLGDGRYATLELRVRHPLGERLYVALGWNYVWSNFNIENGMKSEWRWDIGWRFGPPEPK
jgi:hypothetical protein